MRREIFRKLIHVSSIAVPLLVWVLPRREGLALLGAALATALLVEAARLRLPWFRYRFLRATRPMLRPHERHAIAGATYMAAGYLVALLVFPKPIAVAAMLYNGLGDAAAALVGRRWGRHRAAWGKSAEGFAAGLSVDLLVGLAVPGVGPGPALAGAFTAATLEFLPLPLDDNLRLTLGGGAAVWLFSSLG